MEELKNWTIKSMSDFLRSSIEPQIIQQMAFYILEIPDPDLAKKELESMLGLESEDLSQDSLLLRSHKLNFIDSFIEKKFSVVTKKKQKAVRVELTKKNIEKIQKELVGPGFVGKRICYCMAREHELIGNCLACGKIVCALEGRGACLFCGHQVVAKGEVPVSIPEKSTYTQALKHKNKLLEYDRNAEERLAVIDDQNDWYDIANNTWLSPEDREMAEKMAKIHKERVEEAKKVIQISVDFYNNQATVDLGSRKIIEQEIAENSEKSNKFFVKATKGISANKDLNEESREIYEKLMEKLKKNAESRPEALEKNKKPAVVQNEDPFTNLQVPIPKLKVFEPLNFAEEMDKKQCLSMHQPYASLLVLGFKRFEGREWPTDYRGPLWIHSGAKKPSDEEIEAIEQRYKEIYNNSDMPELPNSYPTGVLLGRVELVDVITNEQYTNLVKDESKREENGSKFLFVVKNPSKLLIPIRMQGSKKIFTLDFDTWNGAKNGLRRVQW